MTYEESKAYFWRWKGIETAADMNGSFAFNHRQPDKDVRIARTFYMGQFGCIYKDGKFHQWYEIDLKNNTFSPAKLRLDGFIGESAIIRSPGLHYATGYTGWDALRKTRAMSNQTYTFNGRVKDILPIESGRSASGKTWKRMTFMVEEVKQNEQYPQQIAFVVHGEKCETLSLVAGDDVAVEFQVSSRKVNDRYFTEAKVITVERK